MPTYNPKDIFIVQRNAASTSFEEVVLSSQPNSYLIFNSSSSLIATSGGLPVISSSYSEFARSSSFATTYVIVTSSSIADFAVSASHLNQGANIYLSQSYIFSDVSASAPPFVEGQMWWDSINHTYTVDTFQSRLQIGQENYIRVIAGEFIPVGSVVYFDGVDVDPNDPTNKIPVVWLAIADGTGLKSIVAGLSTQNINIGDEGLIAIQGILHNLNTFLFSDGTPLYLSSTQSGSFTDIIPSFPSEKVNIGMMLYSHPTVGSVLVSIPRYDFVTVHNNLNLIQGGTGSQYYHLTETEYSGSGTGIFLRQSGSIITGSISNANISISSSYSLSSSWSDITEFSISASYLNAGANIYLSQSFITSNTQSVYPDWAAGRMFWDSVNHTYVIYNDNPDTSLQIGQETFLHVMPGEDIANARAVFISGSVQDPDNIGNYLPLVYKAIAGIVQSINNERVIGLSTHNMTSGSSGWVTTIGVVHDIDTSIFNDGDTLYLSPTIAGYYQNTIPGQPYPTIEIGTVINSDITGSILVNILINPVPPNAYAGIVTNVSIVSDDSGSVIVSTGSVNLYSNPSGSGLVTNYPLSQTTLNLITGSTNYIVSTLSGSQAIYSLTTDQSYADGISIVPVAYNTDIYQENTSSWDVHQFNVGIEGLALANRTNNKDIQLYGYQRQNGLTLYVTGSSGSFGITEGNIWYGPNSHVVPTFDTTFPGYYTYIFHTTASGWHQHTSSIFISGQYDSSSISDFDVCAPDSWSVNFVYRLIGTSDEAAIVLSSQQFATELEASNNATTPDNLPSTIRDMGLLVGRFIVQSGSYNPTIESAFSNTFIPAVVTDHESLLGFKGGTGGEHRHLTANEYVGTGTGVFVKANRPSFTGATVGHVPYWDSLQRLTLTGSVQVVDDRHVLINSASLPPNPSDHPGLLVRQIESASNNVIGGYASVNDFSQFYNQNVSSHPSASTDIVATSDIGGQTASYIDMGIASSNYNDPRWPWAMPLDGYLEVDGGDLWIGTLTDDKIKFVFNNTASTNYADKTGFYLSGSFYGTSSVANNAISTSYALTSSHAAHSTTSSLSVSSSWAPFQMSASWASRSFDATSSSFASQSFSSSYSLTASFASGIPTIKSGIVSGSSFAGNPKTASITFTNSFPNNNYSVTVTGESSRTWTIQNKVSGSFVINANVNAAFTNLVFWQAITTGEFYS